MASCSDQLRAAHDLKESSSLLKAPSWTGGGRHKRPIDQCLSPQALPCLLRLTDIYQLTLERSGPVHPGVSMGESQCDHIYFLQKCNILKSIFFWKFKTVHYDLWAKGLFVYGFAEKVSDAFFIL